ncbi:hypothetical protein U0070_017318 [Myodes glareolus]|uniref:K Homology domain-containing protein n=1 Tax=Myodes glareolus TaxID=447135 RepID=A0AAW0K370_MYOGA
MSSECHRSEAPEEGSKPSVDQPLQLECDDMRASQNMQHKETEMDPDPGEGALRTQELSISRFVGAEDCYILYRRYRESGEERLIFVGEDDIEIEMRVPQEAVKLIIGRQGANTKQLRKQTGARIDVDTEDGCKAKAAINQIQTENTPVSEQLPLPQRSVGRIKEEAAAKHLLLDVSEDEELRKRIAHSAETEVPRKQPIRVRREEVTEAGRADEAALQKNTNSNMGPAAPLEVPLCKGGGDMVDTGPKDGSWEKPNDDRFQNSGAQSSPEMFMFEIPSPDFRFHADEYREVYDKLVSEMTQQYKNSRPEDLTAHVGDIVADPLSIDGSWYGAWILGTLENGNLDLYFVDLGDNGDCSLNYVQTGILTWPKIYLYDTSNRKKLDIGLELIRKGYAVKLPEDIEENRTVPDMLKDMATGTDASLTSSLPETKRSPEELPHTLPCLSLSAASMSGDENLEDDLC